MKSTKRTIFIAPKSTARRRILIAGTGDMIAKCANWGVPAPEWYEDDPDDFRVVLKRPVSEIGAEKTEQKSRVKTRVESRVKSRVKSSVKSRVKSSQEIMLLCLRK